MGKWRVVIVGALFFTLIGCSASKQQEDFHGASWGMTKAQVIAVEEKKGNTDFEEDTEDEEEHSIEFEDIEVNGYKADAEFVFGNKIDVDPLEVLGDDKYIALREEWMDPDTSKERLAEVQEELSTYYQENKDKLEALPSEAVLDDFRLLSGNYYFSELEETDSADLLDSLKEKYGNPQEKNGDNDSTYYEWVTERSLIVFNGENYLAYHTIYGPVKKYGKVNSAESNDDDL